MRRGMLSQPDFSAVRGSRVLIALSGGADSVALACLLAEAREAERLELFAAHLDHGIRPDSAGDARFCAALCARLGIPLRTHRVDVPAECARTGEGLETAARRLRYRWLREVRSELGADCIALAHHLDDQAETVLMHLARGAGPEGIAAMRERSGDLYRPLLGMRKRELVDWLTDAGIAWREDATNALADTPRNAIRLHVLPELEKSYPQFAQAAARYARSAEIESDFVAGLAREFLDSHRESGPYGDYLDLGAPAPSALLRRALRAICGSVLPWEKLNALEALCAAPRGRLEVSGGLRAERTGGGIYFIRNGAPAIAPAPLALNGATRLEGVCEILARPAPPVPVRDDPARQALRRDALGGAVLRTRRTGDRIRPLGCGDRLLSDYLTDRKVDRPLRDWLPLVARGDRVLWACGLGISEDARLRDGDAAVLLECRMAFNLPRRAQ